MKNGPPKIMKMNLRRSEELSKIISSCLTEPCPTRLRPASLHAQCLRTAAVYATTALYEFHDKQVVVNNGLGSRHPGAANLRGGNNNNNMGIGHGDAAVAAAATITIDESMWDAVFPLLDAHFLRLIPAHLYEQFLDNVLCALEVAGHYDTTIGKALTQYIILLFPKDLRRFKAQRRHKDRVLMPTICCLNRCSAMEELYLEKADSPAITTYLLAHVLKYLGCLRVLALPKQCDDDVASVVGINCSKLESIVLTGTNVTNVGLSWLLCCRNLHTVIMPGFFSGITPKGVALLLNGLPSLRHVVYDVMSDVLTYVDFNTSALPSFGLRTMLFHSMELLSSNHLELVTRLCPNVEWLSLDSALFYNLEGLGRLPRLTLLRLNYKGRPLDDTVYDFFEVNGPHLSALHLFDVKDLTLEDLLHTVKRCPRLETLVLNECSLASDWRGPANSGSFAHQRHHHHHHQQALRRPSSTSSSKHLANQQVSGSVEYLQIFGLQTASPGNLVELLSTVSGLQVLEMDRCDLDLSQVKSVFLGQPNLHTLRCSRWKNLDPSRLASSLQAGCRGGGQQVQIQTDRQTFPYFEEEMMSSSQRTMAAALISEYANFSLILGHDLH